MGFRIDVACPTFTSLLTQLFLFSILEDFFFLNSHLNKSTVDLQFSL